MRRFAQVLWLVVIAVLGCSAPQTSQAQPASTNVIHYTPANMKVIATAHGYCWEPSIAADRKDAYRCFIGNNIMDPCFSRDSKSVACPEIPDGDRGSVIILTKPLPPNTSSGGAAPWAFQLSSGGKCRMGTGTVMPGFPYYCSSPDVCAEPVKAGASHYDAECGSVNQSIPQKVVSTKRYAVSIIWR